MTNTEKPSTKAEQKKQVKEKPAKVETPKVVKAPVKEGKKETKSESEKKKPIVKKTEVVKPKKTEAIVRSQNIPISTKDSCAICKFIKNKKISTAIRELEEVTRLKKAVPMKGEIPHRKGKRMMSGRFPEKTARNFVVLLKSLLANANELDEPVIVEAVANIGARPYGRFGRVRKKRTHIFLKAKEKKKVGKKKKGGKK